MVISEKEMDNVLKWDGSRRGWYEVYYLKWNDLASDTAYWIRYTMTSPVPGQGDPYCELWGIFFDAADPERNFALKNRFPISELEAGRDAFNMRIGGAHLDARSCRGELKDESRGLALEWDFRFDSSGPTFKHFPYPWMYKAAFPKTKVLSPHEDGRFTGRVMASGRTIEFKNAPGQQTHIWGTKHALNWAWGHCNAFEEDEGAIWEGLDSQIKVGPFKSPRLALFYLRHEGRDYYFNSIGRIAANNSSWRLGDWTFEAETGGMKMVGQVSIEPRDMVAVTYTDPDGAKLWCNNGKVAGIKLKLMGPGGSELGTLTSANACAAEFVERKTYDEVPVRI